eukprot:COSAG02_NODE_59758_length_273_cov_0.729885_1_plen_50_part_01
MAKVIVHRGRYVLLRGVLPVDAVAEARHAIASSLVAHGWKFEEMESLTLA